MRFSPKNNFWEFFFYIFSWYLQNQSNFHFKLWYNTSNSKNRVFKFKTLKTKIFTFFFWKIVKLFFVNIIIILNLKIQSLDF